MKAACILRDDVAARIPECIVSKILYMYIELRNMEIMRDIRRHALRMSVKLLNKEFKGLLVHDQLNDVDGKMLLCIISGMPPLECV